MGAIGLTHLGEDCSKIIGSFSEWKDILSLSCCSKEIYSSKGGFREMAIERFVQKKLGEITQPNRSSG